MKEIKGKKIVTKIYKENNLSKEDIYFDKNRNFVIITRSGIEKIAHNNGIYVDYQIEKCEQDFVVIKGFAYTRPTEPGGEGKILAISFGSASKETSYSKYYTEMAEKRAMARCVLKGLNYYSLGVFSEDELKQAK